MSWRGLLPPFHGKIRMSHRDSTLKRETTRWARATSRITINLDRQECPFCFNEDSPNQRNRQQRSPVTSLSFGGTEVRFDSLHGSLGLIN